ncbi:hypothetical protein [Trichocoleus sp. FACHB-262]|nr:hypothetical protein [Trichocoleus sp. FACHB-262]
MKPMCSERRCDRPAGDGLAVLALFPFLVLVEIYLSDPLGLN